MAGINGLNPFEYQKYGNPFASHQGSQSIGGVNAGYSDPKVSESIFRQTDSNSGLADRIGKINGELSPVCTSDTVGRNLDLYM